MYAIMGATGNVGGGITEKLLAAGKKVRAIGRNPDKLRPLVDKGADAAVGDVTDLAFLEKTFEGAKAAFFMIPPNPQTEDFRAYQNIVIDNGIAGIKRNDVRYVVTLSSQGAHLPEGNGPVSGLYDMERKFDGLEDVDILHLRPTFFMENNFMYLDMVKNMNLIGTNLRPDAKLSMIATKDISNAGANALLTLGFADKSVKNLLGERDLTMIKVAKILGEAIGKPDLPYMQFPPEDVKNGMVSMGIPEKIADSYIELNEAVNTGELFGEVTRNAENTTETPIEEFAQVFAAVYKG